ncbi:DNA polymerase III, delta subunit [Thiovulum sp. ES]|nr:DNA polymerase III, delta subunit [Thiovulum sp. ES]
MYRQGLEKIMIDGNLPRDLMLFGENFFIDYYYEKIKNYYNADEVEVIYSFEYQFQTARSTLSGGSLFGDKTLLVLKSENKIPNSDLKELRKLISKTDNFLLYLFYGDGREVQKAFGDNFARFFKPDYNESFQFIFEESQKADVILNPEEIQKIYYLKSGDLSQIYGELQKISNLGIENVREIGIENVVSKSGEIEGDKIANHFFKTGDWKKSIQLLEEFEIDQIEFLSILQRNLHDIYLFRSSLELQKSLDSLSVLGRKLPPEIENQKIVFAKKFSLQKIAQMLYLTAKEDLRLKSGKSGDKTLEIGKMLYLIRNTKI